jgi:hypothetical protein
VSKTTLSESWDLTSQCLSSDSMEEGSQFHIRIRSMRIVWSDKHLPDDHRSVQRSCEPDCRFTRENVAQPKQPLSRRTRILPEIEILAGIRKNAINVMWCKHELTIDTTFFLFIVNWNLTNRGFGECSSTNRCHWWRNNHRLLLMLRITQWISWKS